METCNIQSDLKQINNDIFLKGEFNAINLIKIYSEILSIENILNTNFINDLFINMLLVNNLNLSPAVKILYNNIWEMICLQFNLGSPEQKAVESDKIIKCDENTPIIDKEAFPDTIVKDLGKEYYDKDGNIITDFTSLWIKSFNNYINSHKELLDFDDKTYSYSRLTLKDNMSVPEHAFVIKVLFDKSGNIVKFLEPPREIGEVGDKDIDSLFSGFLADLDSFKLE